MPYKPGADWQYDVPTSGSKRLPPDSGYAEALRNQGYSFEVAIADLIDNSLDAGASQVVVHFLRDDDRLLSLLIVDNGRGMNDPGLDAAMTVGHRREYGSHSLGMYGTGLKAASLSHADALAVVSTTKTSRAAGRQLTSTSLADGYRCDTVTPDYAQALLDRYDGIIEWQGTVVRWDRVRTFETVEVSQTDRFLSEAIQKLETHLGLYLHRFLDRGDVRIDIAVENVHTRELLDSIEVEPLDPFNYKVPGKAGYPCTFTAPVEGVGDMELTAHIWPPKSPRAEYKLIGPLAERQGFYFYRNDRLVQAGGWNGQRGASEGHLNLARIAVDLPSHPNQVFSLTVKKEGINATQAFARGVEKAVDAHGRTFRTYLENAEAVYREGSSRAEVKRNAVIPPGKGISPKVKRVIQEELPEKPGEDPIAIAWVALPEDRFFDLDRENRVIQLNKSHRDTFNMGQRGGSNDAPVVKTLLYLMLEELFGFTRWEKKRSDQIDYWNAILLAAVSAQRERFTH
ncbi:ATP-binding protein [Streptomyces sp. NBC_00154]|uniref:ATP-binding protein n=1 Tax=Streptomyces sp. NBC_00154 TaxID=2975670 RepID=UPI002253C799|nr:ATP-binding protein [Streptomyces sp. NBC_00154]MCX5312905.1 ATP-binding protein [Streptomyces sp. NBC_00154]